MSARRTVRLATCRLRARSSASTRPSSVGSDADQAERSLAGLQARFEAFRLAYNEQRPHRAIGRATPGEAYRATPRALPAGSGGRGHFRLRYDVTDSKSAITLRRAGRLHRLNLCAAYPPDGA